MSVLSFAHVHIMPKIYDHKLWQTRDRIHVRRDPVPFTLNLNHKS